jgi:phospholipid/cholesterol/gamma-HCH transport system ATP-binding protein
MTVNQKNLLSKNAVIEIEDLKKSFGTTHVLSGINLKLYEQENLVVLGKSGSGKSVLIKLIVRLLEADHGSIKVFGEEVSTMNKEELSVMRTKIGFLFQSGALYDSMSVRENLEFPLVRLHAHLSPKERDSKIRKVLESVGLPDSLNKMPSELSGGMRKRIGLARTIVVDPSIILYDEPTTGLDPETSNEISELLLKVQNDYKTSSIIITHDIACARMVANRLIMLKDGYVFKEGNLSDFENSNDKNIQSYFHSI